MVKGLRNEEFEISNMSSSIIWAICLQTAGLIANGIGLEDPTMGRLVST
jgi:hypothetical protein